MKQTKNYLLYDNIKSKILNKEYKEGQKLPSKRVQADISGISVITVEKAYEMLEDEGYIKAVTRKGYFVCKVNETINYNNKKAREIKFLPLNNTVYEQDFEYSVWLKTLRKVVSEQGNNLFVKAENKGCAVLRNAIAEYLLRYREMFTNPENIIIGSGAEQLYEYAVKTLGREKVYGIEDPCYVKIKTVYDGLGCKTKPLTLGDDGIISEKLKDNFDVLHVTPFHSYPSGISTSFDKRCEYLKWAKENGKYIIEDDFYSEFYTHGKAPKTLFSLDNGEKVIYINTFSKSISPALRVGYMVLPECLSENYNKAVGLYSCSVPVTEQYVLAEFISSGNFERHLNRVRRKIKNGAIKKEL